MVRRLLRLLIYGSAASFTESDEELKGLLNQLIRMYTRHTLAAMHTVQTQQKSDER